MRCTHTSYLPNYWYSRGSYYAHWPDPIVDILLSDCQLLINSLAYEAEIHFSLENIRHNRKITSSSEGLNWTTGRWGRFRKWISPTFRLNKAAMKPRYSDRSSLGWLEFERKHLLIFYQSSCEKRIDKRSSQPNNVAYQECGLCAFLSYLLSYESHRIRMDNYW